MASLARVTDNNSFSLLEDALAGLEQDSRNMSTKVVELLARLGESTSASALGQIHSGPKFWSFME